MIPQARFLWRFFVIAVFSTVLAAAANAQATRTWVSGVGDDANPCSRTAPCKTFAGAISKTAAGGEINALDSGGFGNVTITKSITIDATSALGGILSSGVNGVIINGTNIVVTLRGLDINGAGTTLGINGVRIFKAKEVHIEDSVIYNFSNFGILDERTTGGALFVKNTTLRANGTGASSGGNAAIQGVSSPEVKAYFDGVQLKGGTSGFSVSNGNTAAIGNSLISGSQTYGVSAAGANTNITVSNCMISGNTYGVGISAGNPTIWISNNTITKNGTGLFFNTGTSGQILSFKDNKIGGNTTENPPSGLITQQ